MKSGGKEPTLHELRKEHVSSKKVWRVQASAWAVTPTVFLGQVQGWAQKPDLTSDEVLLLAEVVVEKVFPLGWERPCKAATFELMADVIHGLAGQRNLSEQAVRVLLDGWCQQVLAPVYEKTKATTTVFFPSWQKVLPEIAQLAALPVCPLGLAGRLWRMTHISENDLAASEEIVRAIAANPTVPSAFSLSIWMGQSFNHFEMVKTTPVFQQAQTEYTDIADLPFDIFLDTLLSLPVPDEWYDEVGLDFVKARRMEPRKPGGWSVSS